MSKMADWWIERIVSAPSENEAIAKFHSLILTSYRGEEQVGDSLELRCNCDYAKANGHECACDDE